MRAEWAPKETLELLLTAMMPANRLAIRASMATGLRIGDVLAFKTAQVRQQRWTVKEQKTGKLRRVYLPAKLCEDILPRRGGYGPLRAAQTQRNIELAMRCIKTSAELPPCTVWTEKNLSNT